MDATGQARRDTWTPLVISPDGGVADEICRSLAALSIATGAVLREYPAEVSASDVPARHRSDVVFLEIASNPDTSMAILPQLAREVPVIAVNRSNDPDAILRCLRRGASEFLFLPVDSDQIKAALERTGHGHGAVSSSKKPGVVHCVLPGKPGCGASTICVHLAIETKHHGPGHVLVADFDSLASSVRFFLKLKAEYHVGDVIQDWKRMDLELWKRLVISVHDMDVLSGPEHPGVVEMDAEIVGEFVNFCKQQYDVIFFDTAGVGSSSARALASGADDVLLVTTNELAAVYSARRSVEYLEREGVSRARIRLLVNRYTPSIALKRQDVEKALDLPVEATLANDYGSIQTALLDGRPVPRSSPFGRSIAEVAAGLSDDYSPKPVKHRRSWFLSLGRK